MGMAGVCQGKKYHILVKRVQGRVAAGLMVIESY